MKYYLIISLLFLLTSGVRAANDDPQISDNNVLVLDASSSMQGKRDAKSKIDLLKDAIPDFIEQWPDDKNLTVLAFGQGQSKSCKRIDTLNTEVLLDKEELIDKISQLKARGASPMLSAIYKAERQLKERKGNIILVSDGGDTCRKGVSVCKAMQRMKSNHPDLYVHVVDMEGDNKTLQCIAEATGGQYKSIDDLKALSTALFPQDTDNIDENGNYIQHTGKLILKSIDERGGKKLPASYIIYSDEGTHIASYTAQKEVEKTLPVGVYTITSIYNLFRQEVKLKISRDKMVDQTFILGTSGTINLSSKYRGRPTSILYTIYNEKGFELVSTMTDKPFKQQLPIGTYKIEAKHDGDIKKINIKVKNGMDKNIMLRF